MDLAGAGGGLMVAVAAALWLAYLVPSWLKRQQYLATERNAVRLQQTIRVLAETAEIPEELRALASSKTARLKTVPSTQAPSTLAPSKTARSKTVRSRPVRDESSERDARPRVSRRLRQSRAVTTLVLGLALILGVGQAVAIVSGGAGSWLLVAIAGLAAVTSLAVLGRLARRSRPAAAAPVIAPRTVSARQDSAAPAAPAAWTPVAVPKPLYLSRATAPPLRDADQHADRQLDPQADLLAAAHAAEQALREVQERATPIHATVPSRFARMGVLDAPGSELPDLDAVLARRRAAG